MPRKIQLVEVTMDCQSQVVLDADADLCPEVATSVVGREPQHPRRDQHDEHRSDRVRLGEDAVVDDDLLDERQQTDQGLGDHRQDEGGDDRPSVTADERTEASKPSVALPRRARPGVCRIGERSALRGAPTHRRPPSCATNSSLATRCNQRSSRASPNAASASSTRSGSAHTPSTSSSTPRN